MRGGSSPLGLLHRSGVRLSGGCHGLVVRLLRAGERTTSIEVGGCGCARQFIACGCQIVDEFTF